MGLNNSIYQDVVETLEMMEKQVYTDRVQTLTLLLEKYAHINKATHLMDYHDFNKIMNRAKQVIVEESFPKILASGQLKKEINKDYTTQLCIMEATISHLGMIDCLKRLARFDYKPDKF